MKLNFIVDKKEDTSTEKKVIHNKNSRRNKIKLSKGDYEQTLIKWVLFKYVGPKEVNPMDSEFFPTPSSKCLNNGLSADSILKLLNSSLVFDFYQPKENDKLNIRMEYKHPEMYRKSRPYIGDFISLIFRKKWEINKGFEHIHNSYIELNEGEIITD